MYFEGVKTIDELKLRYKALAIKNHPDMGGDLEAMKAINVEYDKVFNRLKNRHNEDADDDSRVDEIPEQFREIINSLLHLNGITIELCGSWIWVSGETYPHRAALKEAGMRWSKSKGSWYWTAKFSTKRVRGCSSMKEIRMKYGSEKLTTKGQRKLTA